VREKDQRRMAHYLPGIAPANCTGTLFTAVRTEWGCASIRKAAAGSLCESESAASLKGGRVVRYKSRSGDLAFDDRDSAPFAPLPQSRTPDSMERGKRPSHQAHEAIIYEVHVRA